MKLIHEQTKRGYSWSNRERFYLCESQEEYDQLAEQYKDYDNYYQEEHCGTIRTYSKRIQWLVNIPIHCEPQTIVSDGYATRGGKEIHCRGIEKREISGTLSMDTTSYTYYLNPATIERLEDVKTENWWA